MHPLSSDQQWMVEEILRYATVETFCLVHCRRGLAPVAFEALWQCCVYTRYKLRAFASQVGFCSQYEIHRMLDRYREETIKRDLVHLVAVHRSHRTVCELIIGPHSKQKRFSDSLLDLTFNPERTNERGCIKPILNQHRAEITGKVSTASYFGVRNSSTQLPHADDERVTACAHGRTAATAAQIQ